MSEIIDFDSKKKAYETSKEQPQPSKESSEPKDHGFIKCPGCGGYRYTDVYLLKVVTPFENPQLETSTILPVLLYACLNCGKIVDTTKISISD